jgi:hypothetical protein
MSFYQVYGDLILDQLAIALTGNTYKNIKSRLIRINYNLQSLIHGSCVIYIDFKDPYKLCDGTRLFDIVMLLLVAACLNCSYYVFYCVNILLINVLIRIQFFF